MEFMIPHSLFSLNKQHILLFKIHWPIETIASHSTEFFSLSTNVVADMGETDHHLKSGVTKYLIMNMRA